MFAILIAYFIFKNKQYQICILSKYYSITVMNDKSFYFKIRISNVDEKIYVFIFQP